MFQLTLVFLYLSLGRIYQILKSICDPNHPFSRFDTGNLETLFDTPKKQGLDTVQELLKFHEKYYSANLMKLCIIGKESVETLEKWTRELFSDIPNKKLNRIIVDGHPFKNFATNVHLF